jgi:hypothetical protein
VFDSIDRFADKANFVFAALTWQPSKQGEELDSYFDHLFSMYLDPDSLVLYDAEEALHPFAFATKVQSEDFPSYQEVVRMNREERMKWMKSMDEELQELHEKGAYEFVPRSEALRSKEQIVKSTWAFRRKRKPDGSLSRYKSRLCVRGDLQRGKYTINETFAPVVDWSTVRMLFALSLVNNWESASIDFKNAFVQAQLPSPIYLELPPGYQRNNPQLSDHVMKIKTSLYGDRRAANLWYNKLRKELVSEHFKFKCSDFDPCLFIRDDCMLVVYVDDAIVFARDDKTVASVLKKLGDRGFDYSRDGDFNSYLGVQIEDLPWGTKKLSQPGLTNQLLDVMGLVDSNACRTPSSGPLFQCKESEDFDGSFNYRSALGMLMYLANNTRPEISFAVFRGSQRTTCCGCKADLSVLERDSL